MATYFKSSQVHVFPCAYRGTSASSTIDPEARLNTEKNLTNTGNNLKGTYLIERKQSTNIDLLKVVIGGYYFEIDLTVSGGITWASLQDKYLAIKTIETPIVTSGANTTLLVAWGTTQAGYLDNSGGNFLGLAICDSEELTNATASIQVADNSGNILNRAYLPNISSSTGSKSLASDGCTANGDHATAFGKGLNGTATDGQMVIGSYNGSADGKLFVIGKGSVGSASNAFTVDTSGNTDIAGTLRATGNTTIGDNKFTVAASTGNTTVAGTLGVTGSTTIGGTLGVNDDVSVKNKFTINANTGNTAIAGTLNVTGATTINGNTTLNNAARATTKLNHNSNSETILENSYFTFGGSYSSINNGYIDSLGNAVFLGNQGVTTDKLSAGNATNITLASNLVKSDNNLTISSSQTNISCLTTNISGQLNVGNVSGATNGKIHAEEDIVTDSALVGTELYLGPSGGTSTIAGIGTLGKLKCNFIEYTNTNNITLEGQTNAAITLKGTSITTETNSITLAGDAVYSITFVRTGDTPILTGVWAISTILALPNSIDKTLIQSADFRHNTDNEQFYANRSSTSSTSWTIHIASGPNAASSTYLTGKWYVVKLCRFIDNN